MHKLQMFLHETESSTRNILKQCKITIGHSHCAFTLQVAKKSKPNFIFQLFLSISWSIHFGFFFSFQSVELSTFLLLYVVPSHFQQSLNYYEWWMMIQYKLDVTLHSSGWRLKIAQTIHTMYKIMIESN